MIEISLRIGIPQTRDVSWLATPARAFTYVTPLPSKLVDSGRRSLLRHLGLKCGLQEHLWSCPELAFRSVHFSEDGSYDSEEPMRNSRFNDEQVVAILRKSDRTPGQT